MGILYDKAMMKYKRQNVIDELHELGVVRSKDGTELESLDYNELKWELSIARVAKER